MHNPSEIVRLAVKREEFVHFEDGFLYYWPSGGKGGISAYQLRELADYLDEQNKDLNEDIRKYFEGKDDAELS